MPLGESLSTLLQWRGIHGTLGCLVPSGIELVVRQEVRGAPLRIGFNNTGLNGNAYILETAFNPWQVAVKLSSKEGVLRLQQENPQRPLDALDVLTQSHINHAKREELSPSDYRYALPAYEIARLLYRQSFDPANPHRVPVNTLNHARKLADHSARFVTTPNNDTLYSSANLNLHAGPVRIDVPDFGSRYYSIALIDEFTNNFAYSGRRTTGPKAGAFWWWDHRGMEIRRRM